MQRKTDFIIPFGLFLFIFLPRALPFPVDFIAGDERVIWEWSQAFANAVRAANWSGTLNNAYPAVPFMWIDTSWLYIKFLLLNITQPAGVTLAAIFSEVSPLTIMPERRLIFALVHTFLILAVYWPLRRLFNRRAATFAVILLAFDPLVLAQSRLSRVEALAGEWMLLSVLALLVYFQGNRLRRWLLVSAILGGLAILTKITALFLLPFGGLVAILYQFLSSSHPTWGRFIRVTLIIGSGWGLIAGLVMFVLWPVLWVNPAAAWSFILDYLRGASSGLGLYDESGMFFMGRIIQGDPGPLFYLLTLIFRGTPLAWLGFTAATVWFIPTLLKAIWYKLANQALVPFAALIVFALGYALLLAMGLSKSEHYLLPVCLALDVLAGFGLMKLGDLLASLSAKITSNTGAFFEPVYIVLIIIGQLLTVAPAHPYYSAYWNPFVGGLDQAAKIYPIVTGGEGVDLAMAYLNQKPNAANLTLVCGAKVWDLCHTLFKGDVWAGDAYSDNSGRWVTANYIFIYLPGVQANLYPRFLLDYLQRQPAEYEVSFNHRVYGWLYPAPAAHHLGQTVGQIGLALGYNLSDEITSAGRPVTFNLYWQNGPQPQPGRWLARLIDNDGYLWADTLLPPNSTANLTAPEAIIKLTGVLSVPAATPPGDYHLQLRFIPAAASAQTLNNLGPLIVQKSQEVVPALLHNLDKKMGRSELKLLGYAVRHDDPPQLWLNLCWQAVAHGTRDYALQLELINAAGQPFGRWTAPLLQGRYPTSDWQAGDTFLDPWLLNAAAPLPDGVYETRLSLLDIKTGQVMDTASFTASLAAGEAALSPAPAQHQTTALFGDELTLTGYDLALSQTETMIYLDLTLYWHTRNRLSPYQVVVELHDETGQIILTDAVPLPLAVTQNGQAISRHQLQLNKTGLNLAALTQYQLAVHVGRPQPIGHPYIIDNLPQNAIIITK